MDGGAMAWMGGAVLRTRGDLMPATQSEQCIAKVSGYGGNIEEKIQALAPNGCRGCVHFLRVNFDDASNVTNRQGFCTLGQLEGDWGLYVSCSISTRCVGFVFSAENNRIHEAERKLTDDLHKFLHTLHDKRSANYKAIKPLIAKHKEFSESISKRQSDSARIIDDINVSVLGVEYFERMHKERYWEVYRMVSLKKTHYTRFLATVSMQIHDKFCDCDCLEEIHE